MDRLQLFGDTADIGRVKPVRLLAHQSLTGKFHQNTPKGDGAGGVRGHDYPGLNRLNTQQRSSARAPRLLLLIPLVAKHFPFGEAKIAVNSRD
jgi:hypothetical protein